MSFIWDNQFEQFDEACYSLTTDVQSLQLAGSILFEMASRFPDDVFQRYLDRSLHGFNSEVQQRLLHIGLKLLNAQLCQKNEVVVGAWIGQVVSGYWEVSKIPEGLLPLHDGTIVYQDADWPELVDVLSANFIWQSDFHNVSEGTFRLPVHNNRVEIGRGQFNETLDGSGSFSGIDNDIFFHGGEPKHTLLGSEMPSHFHEQRRLGGAGSGSVTVQNVSNMTNSNGNVTPWLKGSGSAIATSNQGGDGSHNNMQPYTVVTKCIVARINLPVPDTFRLRQSPDDSCLLEQSFNGGSYWTPAFDFEECKTLRGGGADFSTENIVNMLIELSTVNTTNISVYNDNNQPVPDVQTPTDQARANNAICAAVDIMVDIIFKSVLERIDGGEQSTIGDLASGVSDIFAGLSGVFGGIGGLALLLGTGGTGAVVWGFFAILSGVGSLALKGIALLDHEPDPVDFDDSIRADVQCCIYSNLKDTSVSYSNWTLALAGCEGSLPEDVVTIVNTTLGDLQFYLQMLGMMQSAYDALDNGNIPCPCETDECIYVDFTTEESASPWTATSDSSFVSTVGVIGDTDGDAAVIRLDFTAPVFVTSIEVVWRRPKDVPPGLNGNTLHLNDLSNGGFVAVANSGQTGAHGTDTTTFTPDRDMTSIQLSADGSGVVDANYKRGLITSVQICYQGSGTPT